MYKFVIKETLLSCLGEPIKRSIDGEPVAIERDFTIFEKDLSTLLNFVRRFSARFPNVRFDVQEVA